MKNWKVLLSTACALVSQVALSTPAAAVEVLVGRLNGENFVLEMAPEETLLDVQERISTFLNRPVDRDSIRSEGLVSKGEGDLADSPVKAFWLDYMIVNASEEAGAADTSTWRNYNVPPSDENRRDIGFIVTTLADKSIASILGARGRLNDAGDRIRPVHPLRFLECVFTDEKLKVGIRNIQKRGWIWKDFVGGLKGSLIDESKNNNLKDEYIAHFAKTVGIDPAAITPTIREHRWDDLVDLLIKIVPRSGEADRYDM